MSIRRLALTGFVTLGALGAALLPTAPALAATGYGFAGSFGSEGSEPGHFNDPSGVAVNDATGDVYVVDKNNNRVEYFSSAGAYLGQLEAPPEGFSSPEGIAIDNSGRSAAEDPSTEDVYVVDSGHGVIAKFSASGAYLGSLTETTGGVNPAGPFAGVFGVAVDPAGNAWVYEGSAQVDKCNDALANQCLSQGTTVYPLNEAGGPQFSVDSADNVYAYDFVGSWAIVRYTSNGTQLSSGFNTVFGCSFCIRGLAVEPSTDNVFVDPGSSVLEFGPFGEPFEKPIDEFGSQALADGGGGRMAVSATGTLYVSDTAANKVDSFTQGPTPEAPVTGAASEITASTVKFSGTLENPRKEALEYQFLYNTGGVCTGGATTEEKTLTAEEAEKTEAPVSIEATGLQPSTQYTFCLSAIDHYGHTDGSSKQVETGALAPAIDSEAVSGVTPFDATLEGQVNPENQETTYHLEYASKEALLGTSSATMLSYAVAPPHVYGDQAVGPVDLGGALTPGTTYYYRVVAKNATAQVSGTTETFTTPTAEKPSVTGEKLVGAVLSSDTIEGQLNPEFQAVSCEVQYVTKETYEATGFTETEHVGVAGCSPLPPGTESFGQGGSPVPFAATLSGLRENTPYEYRVVVTNGTGTTDGTPQSLKRTPPQITGAAGVSEVTQHTVLIAPSTIIPEVEAPVQASYYIVYGTSEADELATTHMSAGSGLTPNSVGAVELYGLAAGTTYHYAVVAYNGNSTLTGPAGTFTTAAAEPLTTPPTVGSATAQFVSETGTVIQGEINPNGLETTYLVQYGTSTAYGSSTPGPVAIASSTTNQGTITALVGLAPGTIYHYRLVATSQAGTTYGQDETFKTAGAPQPGTFTSFTIPAVPLIAETPVSFPVEEPSAGGTAPKTLTNKQKLTRALKVCAKKPRKQRANCNRHARAKYSRAKMK